MMVIIAFRPEYRKPIPSSMKIIRVQQDLKSRPCQTVITRYVSFIKYILNTTTVEEASKENYDEIFTVIDDAINSVKDAGAYDQLTLYNSVFMLLYDQRASMAQVNVDRQRILDLYDDIYKRTKVKSKFVCKFIFQLCGFIYATFIFKRFD